MADFQAALQATLLGVNQAFASADADLHQEVVSASKAVATITNGIASLQLQPTRESEAGIQYALVLSANGEDAPLFYFTVPTQGYPIYTSATPTVAGEPLQNRQGLSDVFAQMAANPDSPLVRRLAFLLRKPEHRLQGAT